MKKKWAFVFCLLLSCMVIFALGATSIFRVEEIVIQGNQKISAEEIQERLKSIQGENLFGVDLREVNSQLARDKRILQTQIRRSLPNQIVINIAEKKPVLLLQLHRIWGLTNKGEILPVEIADDYQLPVVRGVNYKTLQPYSRPLIPELQLALEFYRAIQSRSKPLLSLISEISFTGGNDLVLTLISSDTEVYLGWKNYEKKLARLAEILALEEEVIASIDLRFENLGVVRYDTPQRI